MVIHTSVDCNNNIRYFSHHSKQCLAFLGLHESWNSVKRHPRRRTNNNRLMSTTNNDPLSCVMKLHHTAIRTRNISTAIQFYSLFGFQVEAQFRSGPAKCCWLTLGGGNNKEASLLSAKIELIEIPSYMFDEEIGTRKRALDTFRNEQLLGLNHIALDVTEMVSHLHHDSLYTNGTTRTTTINSSNVESRDSISLIKSYGLSEYITHVNQTSIEIFGKGLRIALYPRQQIIGRYVFELAFVYDADGSVLELLNLIKVLDRVVDSGWEPWTGEL